jgi:histidine ammonia-lyase
MTGLLHPLNPGRLDKALLERVAAGGMRFSVAQSVRAGMGASVRAVRELVTQYQPVFGINSGFGSLGPTRIRDDHLSQMQRNLVLSHSVGVGPALPAPVVRLMLLLKAASLAHGLSGVRDEIVDGLLALLAADVLPVVPEKGSAGVSGDLAPLAHLSGLLIGVGEAHFEGRRVPAGQALVHAGFAPLELAPKEGLALISGTHASTALAIHALQRLERIFDAAVAVGAMSLDAVKGSDTPFDDRIHAARGHRGQREVAGRYRAWLFSSELRAPHQHTEQVQGPYCLRCQPQVMGACLDQMRHVWTTLLTEANSASDNPLVFAETLEALSGGNLHDEPVAFAADNLALAIAQIGALSERRTALMVDAALSGLPAFLVQDSEFNTGFRIGQATAAALVAENKTLARPASIDEPATTAGQEENHPMAFAAARRLHSMLDNTANIVAIEWLAAAQALDFRRPLQSSPALEQLHTQLRDKVPHLEKDRPIAPDVAAATALVEAGVEAPD